MRRFLALVLAFGFCLLPVSAGAQTYAEYLADQGYSQDEIDEIISSGEDVNSGSGRFSYCFCESGFDVCSR